MVRAWPLALVSFACAGCAGSHTTLQTAETLPRGRFEVIGGGSVPVYGSFSRALVENVSNAARRATSDPAAALTDEELGDALEAALSGVLFQPTFVPELSIRGGLLERFDMGLRYASGSLKLDGKYQFLAGPRLDLAVSAGYVHHSQVSANVASSVLSVFDFLRLVDYSRRDLDAALLFNTKVRGPVQLYGALRYVLGWTRLDVSIPSEVLGGAEAIESSPRDPLHSYLGTLGVRIGSRSFGVLLELSAGWVHFEPEVLGRARNLSGPVVTPAGGLDLRF